MGTGDWFNAVALLVIGLFLGIAANGVIRVAATDFWPSALFTVFVFAALFAVFLSIEKLIESVKQKKEILYGFGHGVYKSYDPRATILRKHAAKVLNKMGRHDPLLDIAQRLEEVALNDDYFVSRNLYPNVDFYSGILLREIGIPTNMYTVMFAIGRLPGWIAHWKEMREAKSRIYRPRQVYTGPAQRDYTELEWR